MKSVLLVVFILTGVVGFGQTAEEILKGVIDKIDLVEDSFKNHFAYQRSNQDPR